MSTTSKMTNEYLCNSNGYDIPTKLTDFVVWANDLLAQVPTEYKGNAEISIRSLTGYNDGEIEICAKYTRPETGEETAERLEREKLIRGDRMTFYHKKRA